jgi:polysaccharide pyruvyl transferase WcaK-like protein
MPPVVHHYFPLGSDNIGDHLVARAIRRAFVAHYGPATFVDMPVNDRYPGQDRPIGLLGKNVDRSNAEADVVLVGGSNLLEPRKPGSKSWDWGVFTDVPSLRRLRPPLVLIGMGTGSGFGKPIRAYSPRAGQEIRLLHDIALASAVRDETTVDQLRRIGVDTICTGCPVTFLTRRGIRPADRALPLLVSFPPSRIVRRWTGRVFMRGAMRYVAWLRDQGVPILVTLHEDRDREILDDWLPAGVETFHTTDVDALIERYEMSRGVIGFRLHAALLGLGLGKPVIPVAVDWRSRAFIETFQLETQSIRPGRLGQFARLRRLTERLLADDPQLIEPLDSAKARYLARYEAFLNRMAAELGGAGDQNELPGAATHPAVIGAQQGSHRAEKRVA